MKVASHAKHETAAYCYRRSVVCVFVCVSGLTGGSHVTEGGHTTGNCQYSEMAYARAQCKPKGT